MDGIDLAIVNSNLGRPSGEDLARSWSWSLSSTGNWDTSMIDGNSQSRTHDKANEILTISGVTFAPLYDEAGNNVRGPRPADPNANNAAHFRYDAWNRLSTVHLDDGNTPGTLDPNDTLLATYRYDGLNRRVLKVTHDDPNTTTGQYVYHNESWQIVEIRRGVNQTPAAAAYKQYAWDIRYIDAPVCRWWDGDSDGTMEPAAGEMQYFTNDGNFNTTALIDANSGSVVERYLYDPYGKVTVLNGAAGAEKDPNVNEWTPDADNKSDWDNDVLFCGYQYDPETGLYHVRNRYYNWMTGRWMTTDPSGYADGVSLYEYCRSRPNNAFDPMGREVFDVAASLNGGPGDYATETTPRDRVSELLLEARQMHANALYFETTGIRQLFDNLALALNNQVTAVVLGPILFASNPHGGEYHPWFNYISIGPATLPETAVHELIHAYDDMIDLASDSKHSEILSSGVANYLLPAILYLENVGTLTDRFEKRGQEEKRRETGSGTFSAPASRFEIWGHHERRDKPAWSRE